MTPEPGDVGATVGEMNDQPHPDGVRLSPWRVPNWLIDAALIGLIVIAFLGRSFRGGGGEFDTSEWTDLAIGIVLLLSRRRFPLPSLAVAVIAMAVLSAVADRPTLLMPVTVVLLFIVGLDHERRVAVTAGAVTTIAFAVLVIALLQRGDIGGAGLAAIAWPAFAITAGAAIRTTRENVAAARERAQRAEQSRQLEARRQVVEERLRIARDVHDLVAHHIAVINVQSGVASHLLTSDPGAASEALDVVRGAAATVVDELGELLGVLRTPDDGGNPTVPTPNLEAITDLISSFAASGLVVEYETSGTTRPLTPSAELAAYRVVQEGLTNAHKYGDGSATVSLEFEPACLRVQIANRVDSNATSGNGFGLVGMRERVEAAGGSLVIDADGPGSVFRLEATLPTKESAST